MKLYEIATQYEQAFNDLSALVEAGTLPQDAMTNTLEALQGELQEKAVNVSAWIKNMDADVVALKNAEAALATRRKSITGRIDWAKEYIKSNMEKAGITKIDCPLYSIKLLDNPPSVHITGEVPDEYIVCKVVESPDKKAIKAALQNGGCDFAELVRSARLVIK